MTGHASRFEIDARTYEELNIFSRSGEFSLFGCIAGRAETTDAKAEIKKSNP